MEIADYASQNNSRAKTCSVLNQIQIQSSSKMLNCIHFIYFHYFLKDTAFFFVTAVTI